MRRATTELNITYGWLNTVDLFWAKEEYKRETGRKPQKRTVEKMKKALTQWTTINPYTYHTLEEKEKFKPPYKRNSKFTTPKLSAAERKDNRFMTGFVSQMADDHLTDWKGDREMYIFMGVSRTSLPTYQLLRKRARLKTLKLLGRALQYKMLGDLDKINVTDDQCVIDALYDCLQKLKYTRKITRNDIRAEFPQFKEGITVEQIEAFAKKYQISVHALDPFMREFYKYLPPSDDHRGTFCFIVNNGHLYPVVDDSYKQFIQKQEFNEETAVMAPDTDDLMDKEEPLDNMTYYVDVRDLHTLAVYYIAKTNHTITEMDCRDGRIYAFRHPTLNTVFKCSENYSDRLRVCKKMHGLIPTDEFIFCDQTMTQLAESILKYKFCEYLPPSVDKSELLGSLSPYIEDFVPEEEFNKLADWVQGYDYNKNFSSILMNMAYDFAVFCPFDVEEVFDGTIRVGEYYINRDWEMGRDNRPTQKHPAGWCPHNAVRYALAHKYIHLDDIKYQLVSTNKVIPKDSFKDFVIFCFETFGNSIAKNLINCEIGMFGQKWVRKEYGAMTTDWDTA
eukprot:gene749-1423_t